MARLVSNSPCTPTSLNPYVFLSCHPTLCWPPPTSSGNSTDRDPDSGFAVGMRSLEVYQTFPQRVLPFDRTISIWNVICQAIHGCTASKRAMTEKMSRAVTFALSSHVILCLSPSPLLVSIQRADAAPPVTRYLICVFTPVILCCALCFARGVGHCLTMRAKRMTIIHYEFIHCLFLTGPRHCHFYLTKSVEKKHFAPDMFTLGALHQTTNVNIRTILFSSIDHSEHVFSWRCRGHGAPALLAKTFHDRNSPAEA